jgi:hypothetical protein
MSLKSRHELIHSLADRYRQASWRDKPQILDEVAAATGYHRKYAIDLLNRPPEVRPARASRPQARHYDGAVQTVLIDLWEAANHICAKRLVPFLPTLMESLTRHGHLNVSDQIKQQLLAISPATVDRLLRAVRQGGCIRGSSTTQRGTLLKHQIPIRTFTDWDDLEPGFCEADLVAHCGSDLSGSFLQSLVLTDVASGWVECVPLLVREQGIIAEALDILRQRLPIPLLGLDTDNDSAFINATLIDYCSERRITFTRSRAYKKNDQCHVEQKNGSIVRRLVGYDRYEGAQACSTLARLYQQVRLYVNFFQPSVKLLEKSREGAKVTRHYDSAQTPCQRLLASAAVDEAAKATLRAEWTRLDPVNLLRDMECLQDELWHQAVWSVASATNLGAGSKSEPREIGSGKLKTIEPGLCKPAPDPSEPAYTARQYRRSARPKKRRLYRTRKDPFEQVWERLEAQLVQTPETTAKALFQRLQSSHPGQFASGQLRTLQRRVRAWRAVQAIRLLSSSLTQAAESPRESPAVELPL